MKLLLVFFALIALSFGDLCRCVFNSGVDAGQMQGALDYVCGNLDCSPINQGGYAFYPDLLRDHAAWAIDAWFQAHRGTPVSSCNFNGAATILCENCTCSFNKNATQQDMKDAMGFVCGNSNCSAITPGGSHWEPNTLENHAGWAVNSWYHLKQWSAEACDFNGATMLEPQTCNPQS